METLGTVFQQYRGKPKTLIPNARAHEELDMQIVIQRTIFKNGRIIDSLRLWASIRRPNLEFKSLNFDGIRS